MPLAKASKKNSSKLPNVNAAFSGQKESRPEAPLDVSICPRLKLRLTLQSAGTSQEMVSKEHVPHNQCRCVGSFLGDPQLPEPRESPLRVGQRTRFHLFRGARTQDTENESRGDSTRGERIRFPIRLSRHAGPLERGPQCHRLRHVLLRSRKIRRQTSE